MVEVWWHVSQVEIPTPDECYANTARILQNAEMETDRQLIPLFDDLARTWLMLGAQLEDRETADL